MGPSLVIGDMMVAIVWYKESLRNRDVSLVHTCHLTCELGCSVKCLLVFRLFV